ncbi:MAG: hypothetical protein CFE45_04195 [Burkholderiales bacterium PBB5]|nr:MAG: hypothetical protein CFE45_04195 [Burkholderiales bacterium PBB5]
MQRIAQRWPVIRRQLPRDLVILLWLAILLQFVGVAWVMTDSVHASLALVLKGTPAAAGDLVVFGYTGRPLDRYYPEDTLYRLQRSLGWPVSTAGPRVGDGFIKYLIGVEGDRIEVEGDRVYLQTRRGRLDMGRCKPTTRHGVPLVPIRPQTIPPGYVYVWAPHHDALDSRYEVMGLVPAKAIVGKAVRLW